jgi:hypothetical protein
MTDNRFDRLKAEIIKVAKELLAESPDDPSVLYELQDFCDGIDADEEGLGFDDGSVYSIKQIKNS